MDDPELPIYVEKPEISIPPDFITQEQKWFNDLRLADSQQVDQLDFDTSILVIKL